MSKSRITPAIQELLDKPWCSLSGRPKTFLRYPERKTHAPSCQMVVYNNDLGKTIARVAEYLKFGAGVKVQLEKFEERQPIAVNWTFLMRADHPDFTKMPEAYENNFSIGVETCKHLYKNDPTAAVIEVKDTMESIENSWIQFIAAAEQNKRIILDVSTIRPAGVNSKTGVISTGLFGIDDKDQGFVNVYFWIADHLRDGKIGSLLRLLGGLCKVVARGGTHKNGIVTTAYSAAGKYIKEYLNYPLAQILGSSKKGVRFSPDVVNDPELVDLIVEKVNTESLFLEKIDEASPELYHNVCIGLFIADKASCLTSPANAGQCKSPADLISALCDMTLLLCLIHVQWRKDVNADPEMYLPLEQDRQVGVTWLGWANFLRMQGVSYKDHVWGMKSFRKWLELKEKNIGQPKTPYLSHLGALRATLEQGSFITKTKIRALEIAAYLWEAYAQASVIARRYGLDRAFGIEPTQRCYKDYVDLDGFTTCRNIDAPFGQYQQRNSEVHGNEMFYHGDVETIAEVGHDLHEEHCEEWQILMDATGLAHGISFDLYKKIDAKWFGNFVASRLKGSYYMQAHKVNQSYLDKGTALIACEAEVCTVCGN